MSIGLKLKLKSNLKKQIEEESQKSGGNDARFLNYWDLKDGEKVKVLFVPDVAGELWAKFKKHGPGLKTRGTGAIRCAYESAGEDCPACQKGFEFLDLAKETEDKSYKDEAKKWFAREYTLMSCIVLESPFEVSEATDHNQVKLIYVPYAIEKLIKEAVTEGQLDEDELCHTPFFIKKTTNQGGYADYSSSYFARKQVADDELAFFDDQVVEQFDYKTLDVIPPVTTTEEVSEWLEKAEEAVAKAAKDDSGSSRSKKADAEKEEPQRPRRQETARQTREEPASEDKHADVDDGEPEQEEEAPAPAKSGGLRDRLAKLK